MKDKTIEQIKSEAREMIERGQELMKACQTVEARMDGQQPKRPGPVNVGDKDTPSGSFTLSDYCRKTGATTVQGRRELETELKAGMLKIVQKGKGRRPTIYAPANA